MKISELGSKSSSPSEDTSSLTSRGKRKRNSHPLTSTQLLKTVLPPLPPPAPISFVPNMKYKKFRNNEGEKRFPTLKGSLITGRPVNFEGFSEVAKCFQVGGLDAIFNFERPEFYYNLISEFYCNLETKVDSGGNTDISSMVTGKEILLNEFQVCRALNLSTKMLDFQKLSSTGFSFDKKEFHKFLTFLCGSPVPKGLFEVETPINEEYFTFPAQFAAHILRVNLLPRFRAEKLYTFAESKLLYLLLNNCLELNLPHLIISHIIASNSTNTMVYGLLFTVIFKYLQIPLFQHPYNIISGVIHGKNVKSTTPLTSLLDVEATASVTSKGLDKDVQNALDKLGDKFEKKNSELLAAIEVMDKKIEELWATKFGTANIPEDNSYVLTTIGDLQNRVYVVEQLCLTNTELV